MLQARVQSLLGYWRSLSPRGEAPRRQDIDLRAIKRHLPDLFIAERAAAGGFSFRLAGTRMCASFGRELRNDEFTRLFPAAQQTRLTAAMTQALASGSALAVSGMARTRGGDERKFEILIQPLADEPGRSRRVAGAYFSDVPQSFPLASDAIVSLSVSAIYTPGRPSVVPAADEALPGAKPTAVSFLRVVEGSRAAH